MEKSDWMIYGANGYTGRLITRRALALGMRPILAGRNSAAVAALAKESGLEYRSFDLASPELDGISLVLHCAGPFSTTSRPMVDACLARKIHYLDITGEIDVLESIYARHHEAERAGCVLIPGVGFDVVPSDCLAATLAAEMPDATNLELAFATDGKVSPGTLKTAVENLPNGGRVRRDGQLKKVPPAFEVRQIKFDHHTLTAASAPWGDVSSAFFSTGIPNITVYIALPRKVILALQLSRLILPLLGLRPIQNLLKASIEKRVRGAGQEDLERSRIHLWGSVGNARGDVKERTLELPDAYLFTAVAAIASVIRVRTGEIPPGAWTPSKAFGADFMAKQSV